MSHTAGIREGHRATTAPRILVVEDDPGSAALLVDVLGEEGYAVSVLPSALGVRGEIARLRPVAIVLDLGLPYCSGATLLADLKADPLTAPIPVVVVSALLEALPPGRAALASARLAKPFAVQDLLAALQATTGAPTHLWPPSSRPSPSASA